MDLVKVEPLEVRSVENNGIVEVERIEKWKELSESEFSYDGPFFWKQILDHDSGYQQTLLEFFWVPQIVGIECNFRRQKKRICELKNKYGLGALDQDKVMLGSTMLIRKLVIYAIDNSLLEPARKEGVRTDEIDKERKGRRCFFWNDSGEYEETTLDWHCVKPNLGVFLLEPV